MAYPHIIESLPPHHVAEAGVDWSKITEGAKLTFLSSEIDDLQGGQHGFLHGFAQTADADARAFLGGVNEVKHTVEVDVDKQIPASFSGVILDSFPSLEALIRRRPGIYHFDGRAKPGEDGIFYVASSHVSTEHLAGRFIIFGDQYTIPSLLLSALMISLQARRCGLLVAPGAREIVRVRDGVDVHRSPVRSGKGLAPGECQVFIRDQISVT